MSMNMRSVLLTRGFVTRFMDSTSRGAFSRFYSDKGRVLSEEEQAKENVYIQKWERERLEKQKQQAEKEKAEKDKNASDKIVFRVCLYVEICNHAVSSIKLHEVRYDMILLFASRGSNSADLLLFGCSVRIVDDESVRFDFKTVYVILLGMAKTPAGRVFAGIYPLGVDMGGFLNPQGQAGTCLLIIWGWGGGGTSGTCLVGIR
ncbi:hypothetical protein Ahy_A09g041970 isoform A [Arachis hypogaea]|uniref:ATPase inhibitor n=1 Tax=Arachis hypogaea TaxID=3818 RepID=A0A445BEF3_ARAHY|nr:hypothetical protein Ahy_A09g041970 isoform A [Arachis hypogaea]